MNALQALRRLGPGSEPPREVRDRTYRAVLEAVTLLPSSHAPEPEMGLEARGSGFQWKLPQALTWAPGTLPLLGGALLAGGLVGAAVFATVGPERVRIVYVDRPVPVLAAAPSSSATADSSPSVAKPALTRRALVASLGSGLQNTPSSGAPAGSGPAKAVESPLTRERTLLDRARQHLARGEPAAALGDADAHESEFSRGKLAEEREALAIRALLSLGRVEEARERGARFVEQFPGSLMAPALEPALTRP